MFNKKVSLDITEVSTNGKKVTSSISNIDPAATKNQLITFQQSLADLSDNTVVGANKVTSENLLSPSQLQSPQFTLRRNELELKINRTNAEQIVIYLAAAVVGGTLFVIATDDKNFTPDQMIEGELPMQTNTLFVTPYLHKGSNNNGYISVQKSPFVTPVAGYKIRVFAMFTPSEDQSTVYSKEVQEIIVTFTE